MRNDALGVVSELAASPNNVITRSRAADAGLDRRRVRALLEAGLAAEPWPGVLVLLPPAAGPTWRQLVAAAVMASPPGAAASHRSGSRLQRLDGAMHDDTIEISVERPARLRLRGVVAHHVSSLPPSDVVSVNGIPTTNVARTLADLGSVTHRDVVERAFDDAVRRGAHPAWLRQTAERCSRPGVAGPTILRGLLVEHAQRGTVRDSWFEALVEKCLAHPELRDLRVQHRLRDVDGRTVARFDLAVPDAKLGIEAHSRSHHFGAEAEASDERRDHEVSTLGWDVMYLGYTSVQSPSTVLEMVLARVRSRRAVLATGEV